MTKPNTVVIKQEPVNTVVVNDVNPNYVVTKQEPVNTVVVSDIDPNVVLVSLVGAPGIRGSTIVDGEGPPGSGVGLEEDIYIDILTGDFWGPKGATAWPATPFYSAGLTRRHVHNQQVPVEIWNITHTLGGYPAVTVVDSASTIVIGEVSYISTSQVRVSFSAPFSGYAYLT